MGYLYRHIRLDKNEVFYIGISLKDDEQYKRAYNKTYRSKWWKRIVDKTDYKVEIMLEGLPDNELKEKEKEFISLYGRIDTGAGTLCNMTDGGQGMNGYNMPEDVKQKLSNAKKGVAPPRRTIDLAIKANKGKPLSIERRRNLGKEVVNIETGYIYATIKEAAEDNGYNLRTFRDYLSGRICNKTPFRLLQGDKSIICEERIKKTRSLNGNAKKVIDISNGKVYECVIDAAEDYGISINALYQQLRGKNQNKTTLRYL